LNIALRDYESIFEVHLNVHGGRMPQGIHYSFNRTRKRFWL